MRDALTITIALVMVWGLGLWAFSKTQVEEIEMHVRNACEAAWPDAQKYQIDRCMKRAMAALADENRLRDNELKRMLVSCEKELERLKGKP